MKVQHRLRARAAVAPAGARVPGLVGGPLHGARGPGLPGALRRAARALRPAGTPAQDGERDEAVAGHHHAAGAGGRHRAPAGEGRQRALRPRLRQVHPLLQVRRGLRRRRPEHLRHRGGRPRLRRAHLHRVRDVPCPTPPASTAATASASARPAPSCSRASTTCAGRRRGTSRRQTQTDTICGYCGVGRNLTLHVQDDRIAEGDLAPSTDDVTRGHLCIKGRFGFRFVQDRDEPG